jgi:hypothetical protein
MARLISHERPQPDDLSVAVAAARERIAQAGPEFGTRAQLISDLEQWARSDLGAWMLTRGGWDGFWTRYAVTYPQRRAAGAPEPDNEVERLFLTHAPAVLATQQRFVHFQDLLARHVPGAKLAMSLPCGAMDDLLGLPAGPSGPVLVGADLDPTSLQLAWQAACEAGLSGRTVTVQMDAWHPDDAAITHGDPTLISGGLAGRVDVLTSNGLNIYVPEDERVVGLYRAFRTLVRPGGILVTSALTPAGDPNIPDADSQATQRCRGLLMMSAVMWANPRPVDLTVAQLGAAGFEVVEVRHDQRRLFPTFLARAC